MKLLKIQLFAALAGLLVCTAGCGDEKTKTTPADYFTAGQQASLLRQVVQKTAKPANSNSPEAEQQYITDQTRQYQWHFAHQRDGGTYFLVSRPAPSLYGKRMAIGGFFRSADNLHINGFKEVFHTFKMKPGELLKASHTLFEKMVNKEDLKSYQNTADGNKNAWIEFPDALNYYDSTAQAWKMKGL